MGLRASFKLGLLYFALLGLFLAAMAIGILSGSISDTGSGLVGTFGYLIFLVLGLPLSVTLAKALEMPQAPWVWALSYFGLSVATGAGGLILVGVLTYKANKKLKEGHDLQV